MREGARAGGAGVRSVGFRDFLVVSEVTLALSLLIVCGLMIRLLAGFFLSKPGFNPRNMLTMSITATDSKHPTFEARSAFCRELIGRVNALSGVESSAPEGESAGHIAAFDKALTPSTFRKSPFVVLTSVSPDYFRTLQLQLLRGHPLSSADYVEKPSVAVVNLSLARTLWPDQEALGARRGQVLLFVMHHGVQPKLIPWQHCDVSKLVHTCPRRAAAAMRSAPRSELPTQGGLLQLDGDSHMESPFPLARVFKVLPTPCYSRQCTDSKATPAM